MASGGFSLDLTNVLYLATAVGVGLGAALATGWYIVHKVILGEDGEMPHNLESLFKMLNSRMDSFQEGLNDLRRGQNEMQNKVQQIEVAQARLASDVGYLSRRGDWRSRKDEG